LKAAVLRKPAPIEVRPLTMEDVPKPPIQRGQVLIEVHACGVCRSNLHVIEGDWVKNGVPAKLPIIPGHEISGTIVDLADDVTGLKKGDRVGVQPLWSACGSCEYCLSSREEICVSKQLTGETLDGGYAEYLVAVANHVYQIPDNLGDVEAAPLFCPGVTAYAAVKKAGLAPGKRVAVFGIGGVGHMVLQFAALYGVDLVAVSRGRQHLEVAKKVGASTTVDPSEGNTADTVRKIGAVDSSIVFAPSTQIARLAIEATKPGGTIVMGVFADLGEFPFPLEKRILGTVIGSRQDVRDVLALASAGKVKAICETHRLQEANDVLLELKKGDVPARAVLALK
jgi:alcohol dehydrogenase, propanol-preferring